MFLSNPFDFSTELEIAQLKIILQPIYDSLDFLLQNEDLEKNRNFYPTYRMFPFQIHARFLDSYGALSRVHLGITKFSIFGQK